MNKNKFKNPKITINKVYTQKGDNGNTQLVGGINISKSDVRIDAYGDLDELNSVLGLCISEVELNQSLMKMNDINDLMPILYNLQHQIFNIGNMIACLENNIHESSPQIIEKDLKELEGLIDIYNENLPPLKSFILPGGSKIGSLFHIIRTVTRRCERKVAILYEIDNNKFIHLSLKFLNRLSDAAFVWARWIINLEKKEENLWNPNFKNK